MKESEEEHVSNAHRSENNDDDDVLPMRTVHANDNIKVPLGRQAQQIKELADIARKTKQTSKIMNFPPIDHDAAISYVYVAHRFETPSGYESRVPFAIRDPKLSCMVLRQISLGLIISSKNRPM